MPTSSAPKLAFVDDRFVPESEAVVSVLDRGFLYGDGLFEAFYAQNGTPFRLEAHLDRLWQGATLLNLRVPLTRAEIADALRGLLAANPASPSVLRLTLSRGVGVRGYSPRGADRPRLVITQNNLAPRPTPESRWKLHTAAFRLPAGDRLAAVKSCSKLAQVLARAEAEAVGADEAVLLNTDGRVAEAAAGNVFFIQDGVVCTPPTVGGLLPGVTRAVVLELCQTAGLPALEAAPPPAALAKADGVFLTLSTLGIVPASHLDGRTIAESPLTTDLHAAYWALVDGECGVAPAGQPSA